MQQKAQQAKENVKSSQWDKKGKLEGKLGSKGQRVEVEIQEMGK